uniref:G-protein coupled receptors family 1 profile domain-containing protein n=1 Tax=Acrobeloides nanus TaxID=290746 RepID=A0A914EEV1_9BILA
MQVYILPLIFTVLCYGSIVFTISIKTKGRQIIETNQNPARKASVMVLRRNNGQDNLQKAKSRTLKMTVVVVMAFMFCWTPYAIAMFVHFLMASSTYRPIPILLSRFLYAFAVFNSAISPYLYGYFSFDIKKELKYLFLRSTTTCAEDSFAANSTTTIARTRRRHAVRVSITNENNADSLQPLLERERHKQLERLTILRRTTLRRGFTTFDETESFRRKKPLLQRMSSELDPEAL